VTFLTKKDNNMTTQESGRIVGCGGIGYSEEDFNNAVKAQFSSLPPIPFYIEDAAKEYCSKVNHRQMSMITDAFRAGAEWMAKQGKTFDGEIISEGLPPYKHLKAVAIVDDGYKHGDRVIIQIRKLTTKGE